jgi:hypothetical protein
MLPGVYSGIVHTTTIRHADGLLIYMTHLEINRSYTQLCICKHYVIMDNYNQTSSLKVCMSLREFADEVNPESS